MGNKILETLWSLLGIQVTMGGSNKRQLMEPRFGTKIYSSCIETRLDKKIEEIYQKCLKIVDILDTRFSSPGPTLGEGWIESLGEIWDGCNYGVQ